MIALADADRDRLAALDEEYYVLETSTDLDQLMRVLISGT
jgi:predicted dehydrogenase